VNEECVVDLLEFRKEILYFMRRIPRHPAESMNDDIENDSDILVIDMITTIIHYCV
jgi:hypothetical protein